MYHKKKKLNKKEILEIEVAIKASINSKEVRRLQSVLFRAKGLSKEEIAELLQYSPGHVKRIWSKYFKEGISGIIINNHGGRRHCYLDVSEEAKLLSKHEKAAGDGRILEIDKLHKSLCELIDKEISLSTSYRIAKRHGWRKIEPRPYHAKRDSESAKYFKIFFPSVLKESSRSR